MTEPTYTTNAQIEKQERKSSLDVMVENSGILNTNNISQEQKEKCIAHCPSEVSLCDVCGHYHEPVDSHLD